MALVSYTTAVFLEECTCIVCGAKHAVDEVILKELRKTGGGYFCPNGHKQGWYDNTEIKRLERELAQERQKRESAERGESFAIAAKNTAERKHKQLEKRVKSGVCPCCHRSFLNVHRHMKTKHPDFAIEAVSA